MTQQILCQSLLSALQLDRALRDWVLARLNLSVRAVAAFPPPADLGEYAPREGESITVIVDNIGEPIALHLIPALGEIRPGSGQAAIDRAIAMQHQGLPQPHTGTRVALIAPPALIRQHWHAAREFPYWIDFDAFTKRQIDQRAA